MTLRTGNKPFEKRDGFTLIEVLIAISILAFGLVGVLRAYSTSTSAMEKAQYDMDAVYLSKIAMGQIEEQAITQGNAVPGVSNGEFNSADVAALDMKRSGSWLWNKNVQKLDLPSEKSKTDLANGEIKSDGAEEPEFYLDKLSLTIANTGRSPLREVRLETYVRAESVKST